MKSTYPSSPIDLTHRAPKAWAKPHKQHIQGIADIDDTARRVELGRDLRHGRQHRGTPDGREEAAVRDERYDDEFLAPGEAVVDGIVDGDVRGVGGEGRVVRVREGECEVRRDGIREVVGGFGGGA